MKVQAAKAVLAQRESLARIGGYGDAELLEAARTLANEVNRLRGVVAAQPSALDAVEKLVEKREG